MQNRGGGGGRQACGDLCPNRVQDLAERLSKKPAKVEKKVPRKIQPRSHPIAIYNDPPPDSVDIVFASIDWQDLADCTSVFQQEVAKVSTTPQDLSSVLGPTPKTATVIAPLKIGVKPGVTLSFHGHGSHQLPPFYPFTPLVLIQKPFPFTVACMPRKLP